MTPPPGGTPPRRRPEETITQRAARELRDAPPDPRWIDISSAITSTIRATTRRTWPIDAHYPSGSTARPKDTLRVSDHVLKTAVHRALTEHHATRPARVDLVVEGNQCLGAHLTITGHYGDVLPTTGDDIAAVAASTLSELLGATIHRDQISVHFDDITPTPNGD